MAQNEPAAYGKWGHGFILEAGGTGLFPCLGYQTSYFTKNNMVFGCNVQGSATGAKVGAINLQAGWGKKHVFGTGLGAARMWWRNGPSSTRILFTPFSYTLHLPVGRSLLFFKASVSVVCFSERTPGELDEFPPVLPGLSIGMLF